MDSYIKTLPTLSRRSEEKFHNIQNVMVSFDVKRLFTIVLIQEALQVIEKRLVEDDTLDDRTLMIPATICHLTEL